MVHSVDEFLQLLRSGRTQNEYSPKWPDGKKRPRNIYAHSLAECEEKLAAMIREVQAEMAAAKAELRAGKTPAGEVPAGARL